MVMSYGLCSVLFKWQYPDLAVAEVASLSTLRTTITINMRRIKMTMYTKRIKIMMTMMMLPIQVGRSWAAQWSWADTLQER